jgi:hypothetical protein
MVRSKAKTTSKGQLTLPVAIRKALNVGAGDVVAFDIGPTASCSGMISRPIGSQSSLANSALAVASPQKRSGGATRASWPWKRRVSVALDTNVTAVAVDWELTERVWTRAGRAFAQYARRRRKHGPRTIPRRQRTRAAARLPVPPKNHVVVLPGKREGEVRQRNRARSGAHEAPNRGRNVNQQIR